MTSKKILEERPQVAGQQVARLRADLLETHPAGLPPLVLPPALLAKEYAGKKDFSRQGEGTRARNLPHARGTFPNYSRTLSFSSRTLSFARGNLPFVCSQYSARLFPPRTCNAFSGRAGLEAI